MHMGKFSYVLIDVATFPIPMELWYGSSRINNPSGRRVMKKLMIDRLRELIDYDPVSGRMTWKRPLSARVSPGDEVGSMSGTGRRYVGIDGVRHLAHRLAWAHATGEWPSQHVSARNDDYDDLRFSNLVLVDATDLAIKAGRRRTNSSGVKGVCWDRERGKWLATIVRGYKTIHIGRYDSKEDAAAAYAKKAAEIGKIIDDGTYRERALKISNRTRQRVQWSRLQRSASGLSDWPTFSDFAKDVAEFPSYQADIVPVDPTRAVGPNNWKWVKRAKFDHQTAEGRRDYQVLHRRTFRASYRNRQLLKAFGITLAKYEEMLAAQSGVCAVCRRPETSIGRNGTVLPLAVDHCHNSSQVRGLLCVNCNQGIGSFRDDPEILRKAIEYLHKHGPRAKSKGN